MDKKALPSVLAFLGAVIIFAGQTGPDQAFANFSGWLAAIGLGGGARTLWASGLAGWLTALGFVLIFTAIVLWWRRSAKRAPPPHPLPSLAVEPPAPPAPAVPNTNPLVAQIDSLIDRLERANEAYARDPDRFYKLSKYSKLWVQVSELDDVSTAVKLAVRRKYGDGSHEEQMVASAIKGGSWTTPRDDDYFRNHIDWMVRLRGVVTLLGHP